MVTKLIEQTIRVSCEICGNELKKRNSNNNEIYVCISPNCENYWIRSRFCYVINIKKIYGEV